MLHSDAVRRSRSRVLLLLVITALIGLVGTLMSPAAQARSLSGSRLDLLDPPTSMSAGAPFFVNHGLCGETAQERAAILRPTSRFELTLDGQPVRLKMYLEASAKRIDNPDLTVCKQYSVSFESGLPQGVHRFVGCWYYLGEDFGCESVEVTFG